MQVYISSQLLDEVPWTHKEGDLALHPVVGFALQVGDVEKFPQALGFKPPDLI